MTEVLELKLREEGFVKSDSATGLDEAAQDDVELPEVLFESRRRDQAVVDVDAKP